MRVPPAYIFCTQLSRSGTYFTNARCDVSAMLNEMGMELLSVSEIVINQGNDRGL